MNESLAWLRDPATQPALSDLLCGLIRDIRLILVHPDLGNAAKLGAITHTVDQLAPPPGPEASAAPAAVDELRRAGVELLGEPGPTWQHFRGPDGNVYELVTS